MYFLPFVSGGLLGWSLGANDTANVFGLAVSTKTIRYSIAILLTAAFALAGAYFGGYPGIRNLSAYAFGNGVDTAMGAFFVMLAAFAAVTILIILAIPASISQAVIGAILGWGLTFGSADFLSSIKFFVSWAITPVGAGFLCFGLCHLVRKFFESKITGLTHYDAILKIGFYAAGIFGAWSMGANSVANVTGVYAGPLHLLDAKTAALIGGGAIALGALTFSKRTMGTIGQKITDLSPLTGLLVVLSGTLMVFIYSFIGIPISSSQAIVGAVTGAGLTKSVSNVNFKTLRKIISAWLITPAAAGLLSFAFALIYCKFF